MTDYYRPSDAVMADHYERVQQRLEVDAALEWSLASDVPLHEDAYGTFARQVQAAHEDARRRLAAALEDLAEQARTIALDYRDHADGSYEPLRGAS